MLYLLLLGPLLGGAAYAVSRSAAARAAKRPPPEVDRIAEDMRRHGLPYVVRVEADRAYAETRPLRADVEEHEEQEEAHQGRFNRHAGPVLADHEHLIAYIVLLSVPAAVGLFLLNASIAMDIGLIQTLNIADRQAAVFGVVVALWMALHGGMLMELLFPGRAIPSLRRLQGPARIGWTVGVIAAFVVFLSLLPMLATARAETRLGEQVAAAAAACEQVRADPDAEAGERILACSRVDRLQAQLQRAKQWDSLVAVAAPLGEAIGLWALLRLGELALAGSLAIPVRRSRRRRRQAERRLDQANAEYIRLLARAAQLAGIPLTDLERWRRGGLGEAGGEAPRSAPGLPGGNGERPDPPEAGNVPPDPPGGATEAGAVPPDAPGGAEPQATRPDAAGGPDPGREPPLVTFGSGAEPDGPSTDEPKLGGDRWRIV